MRPPSPLPLTGKIASAVYSNLQKQFDVPGWCENCIEIRTAPHHTHLFMCVTISLIHLNFNNLYKYLDCLFCIHSVYKRTTDVLHSVLQLKFRVLYFCYFLIQKCTTKRATKCIHGVYGIADIAPNSQHRVE